jgi:hypothetical protein
MGQSRKTFLHKVTHSFCKLGHFINTNYICHHSVVKRHSLQN